MPKYYQVILLLGQLLPIELTKIVTYMYVIIPSQKFKAGQVVFHFECGHISRCVLSYERRAFVLSNADTYSYDVENYLRILTEDVRIHYPTGTILTSTRTDRFINQCACDQKSVKNGAKRICFCKKIVTKFPCESCVSFTNDCIFPFCINLTTSTSPSLCVYHLRCDKCKNRYAYDTKYYTHGTGYLRKHCKFCKTTTCTHDMAGIFIRIFMDEINNPDT
uniref:Uncharacterized protein n=1 Tax=viral metagenome TaxID=1070528 RepID=A0A6C0CAH6_9ZZZZ